jgi:hypothetical protein
MKILYKGETFNFSPEIGSFTLRSYDSSFSLTLRTENILFEIIEQPVLSKNPRLIDLMGNVYEIIYEEENIRAYAEALGKEWILIKSQLSFSKTDDASLIRLAWNGCGKLDDESDEFFFETEAVLKIKPGNWQCDYEKGGDLYVQALRGYLENSEKSAYNDDENFFLNFVEGKIKSGSTTVVLSDSFDESVMRCLGNAERRILECGLWIRGVYKYYAIAIPSKDKTKDKTVEKLYYDDQNFIEASSNEVLLNDQVIEVLHHFFYTKDLPKKYVFVEKEKYFFR